jgi:glycosyltransferase involved in cell wall biosynthesis
MPRAMIEAMARGLPSIGSAVGGIPELLDAEDLVPPGSAEALAAKILEVIGSASRIERMSRRCLQRAGNFVDERLRDYRRDFLFHVQQATSGTNPLAARTERFVA